MNNHRFYINDHVQIEEGENGVSKVTALLPSHMAADMIEVLEQLLHIARWMHTRTRSAEAVYLARRFRDLNRLNDAKGVLNVR
jgi:hypothetical protein